MAIKFKATELDKKNYKNDNSNIDMNFPLFLDQNFQCSINNILNQINQATNQPINDSVPGTIAFLQRLQQPPVTEPFNNMKWVAYSEEIKENLPYEVLNLLFDTILGPINRTFLLDSGSPRSLITTQTFNLLKEHKLPIEMINRKEKDSNINLMDWNGNPISMSDKLAKIQFKLNNTKFSQTFLIVTGGTQDILGEDFKRQNKISVIFGNKYSIYASVNSVQNQLGSPKAIVVSKFHTSKRMDTLPCNTSLEGDIFFAPLPKFSNLLAPQIITSKNHSCNINLNNPAKKLHHLEREIVGHVHEIKKSQILTHENLIEQVSKEDNDSFDDPIPGEDQLKDEFLYELDIPGIDGSLLDKVPDIDWETMFRQQTNIPTFF